MKTILKKGINENKDLLYLRNKIVDFKEKGISQKEVEEILYELRTEFKDDESKEDRVLDLLDFVSGWCQERFRIWKTN